MQIEAKSITKKFGGFTALQDVNLKVPEGQLVALLGPSGSGKTTLLRIISGLEAADAGQVVYGDSDVSRASARERNVGFVFQHYALFNHMSVRENIAFGLRVRKWKRDAIDARVTELLKLIQLESLAKRFPSQLSGGQRQRVALARALAPNPRVLLLDEPFGALDAKVRQELRRWLRRLHDEIHMTSVFVTHDQEEAFEVADRVVVMNKGRIEQDGAPDDVFLHPANAFVMDFIGGANQFSGQVENGVARVGGFNLPTDIHASEPQPATVYIRPHELELSREAEGQPRLPAQVVRVNRGGPTVKVSLMTWHTNVPLEVEVDHARFNALEISANDTVYVWPRQARIFVEGQSPVATASV